MGRVSVGSDLFILQRKAIFRSGRDRDHFYHFCELLPDWGRDLALLLGQKRFRCYSLTTTKIDDKGCRQSFLATYGGCYGDYGWIYNGRRFTAAATSGWGWVKNRSSHRACSMD